MRPVLRVSASTRLASLLHADLGARHERAGIDVLLYAQTYAHPKDAVGHWSFGPVLNATCMQACVTCIARAASGDERSLVFRANARLLPRGWHEGSATPFASAVESKEQGNQKEELPTQRRGCVPCSIGMGLRTAIVVAHACTRTASESQDGAPSGSRPLMVPTESHK